MYSLVEWVENDRTWLVETIGYSRASCVGIVRILCRQLDCDRRRLILQETGIENEAKKK